MNYFELYPGDYLKATGRLTLTEHGAYLRLLMEYYATEEPLPADYDELYVVASAIKPADRVAVKKVADRFFPIGDDGLHHNERADIEIEKAQKRMAIARENGAKGGRPRKAKTTPKKNPAGIPTGNPAGIPPAPPAGNPQKTQSGEALHTPHAIHHQELPPHAPSPQPPAQGDPTTAGRACLLMREAGCLQTNPSFPDLIAAIAEGVTPETLAHTVREGLSRPSPVTNPFPWAITTARARHAAGAKPVSTGDSHAADRPREGLADRAARRLNELAHAGHLDD